MALRRIALAIVALVAALSIAYAVALRVPSPVSLNYVEGFAQIDAQRVAAGSALYRNPASPPWTLHVYTPLYTFAVAAITSDFGSYAPGRLLSLGALLATALLLGASGARRAGWVAWIIAGLYLSQPLLTQWGAVVRPDNLAVFFSAVGVVCVERLSGLRGLLLAAVFFLLALATKQSVGLGLLAAILFLLLQAPRRALVLVALVAVGALSTTLALEALSGNWFIFHTWTANLAPFSLEKSLHLGGIFLREHVPLVAAAFAVLIACGLQRRLSIHALWFAGAAVSTVASGRIGADTNYFLESLAAAGFLLANEWPVLRERFRARAPGWLETALLTVAIAMALFQARTLHANYAWIEGAETRFLEARDRMREKPGAILSDDAGLLVSLDRPLVYRPFAMTQLVYAGDFDPTQLVQMLESGEFAFVVFEAVPGRGPSPARYTAQMRAALARNYRSEGRYRTFANFEVYAPRRPGSLDPAL